MMPKTECLSVRPDDGDFPARCSRPLGHTGDHAASLGYLGPKFPPITWASRQQPGDRHIERITQDCLERRLPPEQTALRLLVASDFADVLEQPSPSCTPQPYGGAA